MGTFRLCSAHSHRMPKQFDCLCVSSIKCDYLSEFVRYYRRLR